MDQDIDQMISRDVEPPHPVVEGKGEIHDSPWFEQVGQRGETEELFYLGLIDDLVFVIKDKGAVNAVAVDENSQDDNGRDDDL